MRQEWAKKTLNFDSYIKFSNDLYELAATNRAGRLGAGNKVKHSESSCLFDGREVPGSEVGSLHLPSIFVKWSRSTGNGLSNLH